MFKKTDIHAMVCPVNTLIVFNHPTHVILVVS